MKITRALIIDDPWIGYILDGSKTWEMRSRPTRHRGWFGLIRKGTGAIHGIARLVDVGQPLSRAEMLEAFEQHRIPAHKINSGATGNWNTPWKLAGIRRLDGPVPYRHKNGAVTWVVLDPEVINALEYQLNGDYHPESDDVHNPGDDTVAAEEVSDVHATPPVECNSTDVHPQTVSVSDTSRLLGEIKINQANIDHDHLYLRPLMDKFSPDVIGGSNKAEAAKGVVIVDWGGPDLVRTDIDGHKKFFRARGWIRAFFRLNRAEPGDFVIIEQSGQRRYKVRLRKCNGNGAR